MTEIIGHDFESVNWSSVLLFDICIGSSSKFGKVKVTHCLAARPLHKRKFSFYSVPVIWEHDLTQKSGTSWSTGSGDAVLISLSELRWKSKVFYAALLYQFTNMEMIKVHPPDMEASSRILNTLFPFSFLRESKSSLPHVQELTVSGKEVIRDLSSFNDPGPLFSCNMFSWIFRIHHDIGKFHPKITQCKAL